MATFAVYPNRKTLVASAILAFSFVLLGIFIVRDPSFSAIYKIIVVLIGIASFGLSFAYCAYRLAKPVPVIVISVEGLFENASAVSVGWLKWSEIEDAKIYRFLWQRFLGIIPVDLELVLGRMSPWKRLLMRTNKYLVGAPFNIPQQIVAVPLEELLAKINEFRRG